MATRPAVPSVVHTAVRFVARLLIGVLVAVELLEGIAVMSRRLRHSMNSAWDRTTRHERVRTFSEEVRWLVRLHEASSRSLSTEPSGATALANPGGKQ